MLNNNNNNSSNIGNGTAAVRVLSVTSLGLTSIFNDDHLKTLVFNTFPAHTHTPPTTLLSTLSSDYSSAI